ncbi:hypothetical protein JCM1840_001909 [Sporobolomyces johnsonii]
MGALPSSTRPLSASPTPSPTSSAPSQPLPSSSQLVFPPPLNVSGPLIDLHDPSVCQGPGGELYLFSTGIGLPMRVSYDQGDSWSIGSPVFPDGAPAAAVPFLGGDANGPLWAPDCTYLAGVKEFVLYYAASTLGSQHSGIFLATTTAPLSGKWSDGGVVLESNTSVDWNAIDPHLVVEKEGGWWMSFGSFWSGIKLIQLDPTTKKTLNSEIISIATRTENHGAIEGSFVVQASNNWWLFASFDACCSGLSSTYSIHVSRSTSSIEGPYVDKNGKPALNGGGTLLLGTHEGVLAPGGQSVWFNEGRKKWEMVYHYITKDVRFKVAFNNLDFGTSDGWPVVV